MKNLPPRSFPVPDGVVFANIDNESGKSGVSGQPISGPPGLFGWLRAQRPPAPRGQEHDEEQRLL